MSFRAGRSWIPTLCICLLGTLVASCSNAAPPTNNVTAANVPAAAAVSANASPATVAEAARVLDLSTLPLAEKAQEPNRRNLAGLSYQAAGDVLSVFEFHRRQLIERKWRESPGAYVTAESASATFQKDGYATSLMVSPISEPGMAHVNLLQHGNAPLDKLPLPAGAKPLYQGPASAMFVADAPVKETAAACRKLLLEKGWQPYGVAGDSLFFKQNAVRLTAFITAAPAQGGKTAITYSSELMSVDLPAPADTIGLQYSDQTSQLMFDTPAAQSEVDKFYRQAMSPAGWKATLDKPIQIDHKEVVIFRNPQKDMLTLEMYEVEGRNRISLKHQTKAEVDELDSLADAYREKIKAEQNARKNKTLPQVSVALPVGLKELQQTKSSIEFKVAAGQAKPIVAAWRKQFGADGWKEQVIAWEDMVGTVLFGQGDQQITAIFSDTGFLPAEVTLSATGAEFAAAPTKE
jgi:hypothetical protein